MYRQAYNVLEYRVAITEYDWYYLGKNSYEKCFFAANWIFVVIFQHCNVKDFQSFSKRCIEVTIYITILYFIPITVKEESDCL